MAEMEKDGTATAAAEAGSEHDETQEATETAETATGKAGEPTDEEKAAAAEAEEAAAREKHTRENTPGTVEYLEKRVEKERDARKKMGITLTKAEERAIRAEERAKVLEEMIDRGQKAGEKKAEPAKEKPLVRPRMKDFDSEDAYDAAVDTYDAEKEKRIIEAAETRFQATLRQGQSKTTQEQAQAEARKSFESRRGEIAGQFHKEYGEAALKELGDAAESGEFFIPEGSPMQAAIWESPHAAKIVKHLYDHPEAMEKLPSLSGVQQVKEIDRIERIVTAAKPRVPSTPDPVKVVGGASNPPPKSIKEAKTSEERFAIWEREQKEALAQR